MPESRRWQSWDNRTLPSAEDTEAATVAALNVGADDYLTGELVAQVRAGVALEPIRRQLLPGRATGGPHGPGARALGPHRATTRPRRPNAPACGHCAALPAIRNPAIQGRLRPAGGSSDSGGTSPPAEADKGTARPGSCRTTSRPSSRTSSMDDPRGIVVPDGPSVVAEAVRPQSRRTPGPRAVRRMTLPPIADRMGWVRNPRRSCPDQRTTQGGNRCGFS